MKKTLFLITMFIVTFTCYAQNEYEEGQQSIEPFSIELECDRQTNCDGRAIIYLECTRYGQCLNYVAKCIAAGDQWHCSEYHTSHGGCKKGYCMKFV